MSGDKDHLKSTLSYRPDITSAKKILTETEKTIEPEAPRISSALSELKDNLPSIVIGKADMAIAKTNVAMAEIEGRLQNDEADGVTFAQYKQALNDKDYDVQNTYEENHRSSLEGKVEAEMYGTLYSMKGDLEKSRLMVIEENYGDSINSLINSDMLDKVTAMDQSMLDQMVVSEQAGEDRVNYGAVYLDTAINNGMGRYFDSSGGSADRVLSIIDQDPGTDETTTNNQAVRTFAEQSFNDEIKLNKGDVNKMRQLDRGTLRLQVQSTMYKGRAGMIEAGASSSALSSIKNSTVKTKMTNNLLKSREKASQQILDLSKVNLMERIYRTDLLNTVESKNSLRQFYSKLK